MVKYQPQQKGKGGQTGASTSTTTSGTTLPDIASVLAAIDRALSQPAPQESEAQEPGAEEPVDRQQILQHQEQGHMEQELPPSEMLRKALEEQKRVASEKLERQKREQEQESLRVAYEQKAARLYEEYTRLLVEAGNIHTSMSTAEVLFGKAKDIIAEYAREQEAIRHLGIRPKKEPPLSLSQMQNKLRLVIRYKKQDVSHRQVQRSNRDRCCRCC